jgi:hypothetical protein
MMGHLRVVRHDEVRDPADRREAARVRTDPVAVELHLRRGELEPVPRAHDGDEDLRFAHLAG